MTTECITCAAHIPAHVGAHDVGETVSNNSKNITREGTHLHSQNVLLFIFYELS